jgi:ATP-dependent Clp protease adaptor protein ClpS
MYRPCDTIRQHVPAMSERPRVTSSGFTLGPREDERGTPGGAIATRTRPKTQRPSMYKVLLLNDDYTPMEFVVHVLERFFGLNNAAAVEIMLTVHRKGVAVVGVFSYEIAETKVTQVMEYSRRNEHPLQCTMEKE